MDDKIVLLDELGQEQEFIILATFGVNDDDYAALLPADDIEGLTYILRIDVDDNGEMVLSGIDDEKELEEVSKVYEEIQEENFQ